MTEKNGMEVRALLAEVLEESLSHPEVFDDLFDAALEPVLVAWYGAEEVEWSPERHEQTLELLLRSRPERRGWWLAPSFRLALAGAAALIIALLWWLNAPTAGRQETLVKQDPRKTAPQQAPSPEKDRPNRATPEDKFVKKGSIEAPLPPVQELRPPLRLEAGRVAAVSGQVEIRGSSKQRPSRATAGSRLFAGARLETGDIDRAELRLSDGSIIRLAFNTSVEMLGPGRGLRLLSGRVWLVVHKDPSREFVVLGPTAKATVLGTEFGVGTGRQMHEGRPVLRTDLAVKSGRVRFENSEGSVVATSQTESYAYERERPSNPKPVATIRNFPMKGFVQNNRYSSDTVVSRAEPVTVASAGPMLVIPGESADHPDPKVPAAYREKLRESGLAILDGKVRSAIALLETSDEGERPPAAWNNLAVAYDIEGKFEKAVRAYGRAVLLEPDAALFRLNYGKVLMRAGNTERGLEEIQTAARLAPRWTKAQAFLAETLMLSGRYVEAIEQARKISQEKEDALSLSTAGNVFYLAAPRVARSQAEYAALIKDAEALLRKALELQPNELSTQIRLAGMLLVHDRLDEAWPIAQAMTKNHPRAVEGWAMSGLILQKQNKLEEAEQSYRKALEVAPDDAITRFNLAALYADSEKYAEAEPLLREAIKTDPTDAESHALLGHVLMKRKDFATAEKYFRAALRLEPNSSKFHYDLGLMYVDQKNWATAAAMFQTALKLDANNVDAWVQLAQVRMFQGRFVDSAEGFRKAWALAPDWWMMPFNLGTILERLADWKGAEEAYSKARDIAPEEVYPAANLATILLRPPARPAEAKTVLDAALKAHPEDASLHGLLGRALVQLGMREEGLAETLRALQSDAALLPAYLDLSSALSSMEPDEAERRLIEWRAREPNQLAPAIAISEFYAVHSRAAEARPYAEKVLSATPGNPYAHAAMASVLAAEGKLVEAQASLRKAIELAGEDTSAAEYWFRLGVVLRKAGSEFQAMEAFRKSLWIDPSHEGSRRALGGRL